MYAHEYHHWLGCRAEAWGKMGGTNTSNLFSPLFLYLVEREWRRGREGEKAVLKFQTIAVLRTGTGHLMPSYKPQCGEECSQGIAWLLLIVLIRGWFCFCESRKTFPRSIVCQSPSFCIHSPRYLLTKLGQESCSTCCALHSLTQRLMLCRLKLADCYVPHVHLSMPSTAQWYLLLLRMKLGWVKN